MLPAQPSLPMPPMPIQVRRWWRKPEQALSLWPVQRMVPVAEDAVAEVPVPAAIRPMAEVAGDPVQPWRPTGQPPLLVAVSVHYSPGRRSGGTGPAMVLDRRLHWRPFHDFLACHYAFVNTYQNMPTTDLAPI